MDCAICCEEAAGPTATCSRDHKFHRRCLLHYARSSNYLAACPCCRTEWDIRSVVCREICDRLEHERLVTMMARAWWKQQFDPLRAAQIAERRMQRHTR